MPNKEEVLSALEEGKITPYDLVQIVLARQVKEKGFKYPKPYVVWSNQLQPKLVQGKVETKIVKDSQGADIETYDWETEGDRTQELLSLYGHRGQEKLMMYFISNILMDRLKIPEERVEQLFATFNIDKEEFDKLRNELDAFSRAYDEIVVQLLASEEFQPTQVQNQEEGEEENNRPVETNQQRLERLNETALRMLREKFNINE